MNDEKYNLQEVIIDGDSFFYAAYAKRKEYSTVFDIIEQAQKDMTNILSEYMLEVSPVKHVKVALTSMTNFRKELNSGYKAKRPPKPAMLREALIDFGEQHNVIMRDGLEADDICVWHQKAYGTTIIAYDKDILLQAPGYVYNWKKRKLLDNREVDVEQNILRQMVQGDRVDCISGVEGYGEVKTNVMFQDYVYIDDVVELFADEEEALETLQMVSLYQLDPEGNLNPYQSVYDHLTQGFS